jgi:plastocyanin
MRLIYGTLSAVALALMFAGCGGSSGYSSSPAPTPTPTPTPTPGGATVSIVGEQGNRSFTPNPATPAADGKIAFLNSDRVVHHIVANDGSWDAGNINPSETSVAVTVPSGGSNFHCSIHPSMVGVVNSTAGATPPCSGIYC